ncbi:exonuclease domain-containing protein [Nitrincola schmidtii]|uniref:3'-5' exonuclease n=1 Tax=Nitrincola schmidtii TaxID=1730894 RepID=UPI00124EEEF0|nr:exonuclease domain-containing protein [Nitrincola schmidtii]
MLIIDIEASGLDPDHSYPIEIGIYNTVKPETSISFLIKPHEHWDYWDECAEEIHGITHAELQDYGIAPEIACNRLNHYVCKMSPEKPYVISDAPDFDFMWLKCLFLSTDIRMQFKVTGIDSILEPTRQANLFAELERQEMPHRALADARIIGEILRGYIPLQ